MSQTIRLKHQLVRFLTAFLIPVLFAISLGCDSSGVQRYRFSGTVSYQGKPVPQGTIMLEPDTSKGNSGAAGSAAIVDGRFDSSANGTGFTGGPQIVSIQGFDGVNPEPDFAPYGAPIGKGKSYIKPFDFPEEDVEMDFEMADVIDAK